MIRAQYYFRSSDRGLLAWDVRRLIALSAGLPICEVQIARLAELDQCHWYKQAGALPTCRSIVEHCALIVDADLSYPIILDSSGRVMDGMHRVCKALLQDKTTIGAVRFESDPEPDFVGREPDRLPYDDGRLSS